MINRIMCRRAIFLCIFVVSATVVASAKPPSDSRQNLPCGNVTMMTAGTLSALPQLSQNAIRMAVRPGIQAIVNDRAMGLEGTSVDRVPLSAIQVSGGKTSSALYVVSWADSSFGVNDAIWIVEVATKAARNLVQPRNDPFPSYFLGGFGFEVLSSTTEIYPEIMIASSGIKDGGGAEVEEVCLRKAGKYYENIACPATCHETLNSP